MRVSPSAKEASTASTGYSSIMLGARSGGTMTPFNFDARTRMSAIGSPPSVRSFRKTTSPPISCTVV